MIKVLLVFVALGFTLQAASFNCNKAKTSIEKQICTNPNLSQMDEQMSMLYKKVLDLSLQNKISTYEGSSNYHYFKLKQKKWLKQRNKTCSNYKAKEQRECLESYYKAQIEKLKIFADGSMKYRNFGHVIYLDTHRPYIATQFKPYMTKQEYKKFFDKWKRWTDDYDVCKDRFGVIDDKCAKKVSKEKASQYNKLLSRYKNHRFLENDKGCIELKRKSFSYIEEDMCFVYNIYDSKELQQLFLKPIKYTDINITIPKNPKHCTIEDSESYTVSNERIMYITKNIVVVQRESYDYTGGLHGDYSSSYINLDRHTGDIITWKDIFGNDKKALFGFIVQNVRNLIGLEYVDKQSDQELYDMSASTSRMRFTPKGIIVTFGLYEISGYADGEPSFLIPLDKLKTVISKEKIAYYFAKPIELQTSCINQ